MKKLFLTLAVCSILVSCGGNSKKENEEIVVKPFSTEIKGDLKGYYELADKDVTIQPDGLNYKITVELKRNAKDVPFDKDDTSPYGCINDKNARFGIGIEFLDENDNILFSKNATEGGINGPYSDKDVQALIRLGKDESSTIRWNIGAGLIEDNGVPAKIRITSALENGKGSSKTEAKAEVSSDNEWDSLLDEYENYCTKLASMSKKVMGGDYSAMEEYSSLLEQAESLQSRLEDAKSDMTTAQAARLNKIASKMASSMM